MNVIRRFNSFYTAPPPGVHRPINGVVLHHTATEAAVMPHAGGSWHYAIGRDGAIYLDVAEGMVAWGAASTDKWRPLWVVNPPPSVNTSAINWSCIHIEIAYAPQAPHHQTPNPVQYDAMRALLTDIYARHGRLPIVGHGQIQLDKWPTEPHGFDYAQVGISGQTANGRYYTLAPEEPEMTEAQQLIVDAAARHGLDAAGIDQTVGVNRTLGEQVNSLSWLLRTSQDETHAQAAEVERLRTELAAGTAPTTTLGIKRVEVVLDNDRVEVLTR